MADYRISVEIDPTGARRGGRRVRGELDRIDNTADRTRQTLARVFSLAAITAGIGSTIRLLARFEQEMSTVRAVTGANEAQFRALREEAKRLGSTTRFSGTEAAQGMVELARAGFDVNQTLGATSQTLLLAQAGALGLKDAADIASNVLQGFQLEVSESQRVVDVLAASANSANTTVGQLGQAMSFVASASGSLGVSLETTAAAVGALSDAGVQSTRAGTGLRQIFIQLQDSGDSLLNILERGLVPVLQTLRDRNIGLSEAAELVGSRQATSLLILTQSIPKIKELSEEYENAEGAAAEIARIMDDNLNGAILSVRSALEGLVLELGDSGATGAFEGLFRVLASGLRLATENIQTTINALETLAIMLAIRLARQAIPAAIAGIRALTLAIIANPIGALLTVLSTGISLLIAFSDQMAISGEEGLTLQDILVGTAQEIGSAFKSLFDFLNDAMDVIVATIESIVGPIDASFIGILYTVENVVENLIGVFAGAYRAVISVFGKLPRALGDLFFKALNGVISIVESALNELISGVNVVTEFFDLGSIGEQDLSVTNPMAGKAAEAGRTIAQAFREGFDDATRREVEPGTGNTAEGFVDRILGRARERAQKRAEDERVREALGAFSIPGDDDGDDDGGGGGGGGGSDQNALNRQALLANELRLLDQEAEALQLVGDERRVLEAQLAVEAKLRSELRQSNEELTESELNRMSQLTEAEAQALEQSTRRNLQLERQANLLEDITGPARQYEQDLKALNIMLKEGSINQEQFNDKLRDLRIALLDASTSAEAGLERGILKIQRELEDTATLVEDTIVGAFFGAEDALVDFVATGKASFSDLTDSILRDLSRLAVRQGITGPLGGLLFGESGSSSGGSSGGILGSILGGFGGGSSPQIASGGPFGSGLEGSGGGGIWSSITSGLGSLIGFANGGQFEVGGSGGRDNNLLSVNGQPVARVSRGETVTVDPEDGGGRGRPIQVTFNISTPDADSFKRSQGQILARTSAALQRASQRNN